MDHDCDVCGESPAHIRPVNDGIFLKHTKIDLDGVIIDAASWIDLDFGTKYLCNACLGKAIEIAKFKINRGD